MTKIPGRFTDCPIAPGHHRVPGAEGCVPIAHTAPGRFRWGKRPGAVWAMRASIGNLPILVPVVATFAHEGQAGRSRTGRLPAGSRKPARLDDVDEMGSAWLV